MRPCRECGEPTRAITDVVELCPQCLGVSDPESAVGKFTDRADQLSRPATIKPATAPTPLPATSWAPVPLAGYVTGTKTDDPPTVLERTDGAALLYPGRLHAVFG